MSTQIDCPVCLNAVTYLVNCATTNCGHKFHTSCLLKCVSHLGFSCPYCRNNMANVEEHEEEEEEEEEEEDEPEPEPAPVDDEPIIVKRIVFNGIAYLVAKRTGEVYDFNAFVHDREEIKVGRWNTETQQVELTV